MDESEALAAVAEMRSRLILWALVMLALASIIATLATRSIVGPAKGARRRRQ